MAATASRRSWSQVMTSTLSSEEPSSAGIADSGQLAQLNASRGAVGAIILTAIACASSQKSCRRNL